MEAAEISEAEAAHLKVGRNLGDGEEKLGEVEVLKGARNRVGTGSDMASTVGSSNVAVAIVREIVI